MRGKSDLFALVVAVGVPMLLGVLGSVSTASSVDTWYRDLAKPSWNPPSWVFAPVWTTLYVMMGISAWLVWRSGDWSATRPALLLFGVQLLLNAAWSPVFFGLRNLPGSVVVIGLLWVALVATMAVFATISRLAAVLLVPYLAWVSFASVLNLTIWRLSH